MVNLFRALPLLLLGLPALAPAEPLRVALLGDYRPLSSGAAGPRAASFEAALLEAWRPALSPGVVPVDDAASADVRMGPQPDGLAYYQSEPAALTRTEQGLDDWQSLQGRTFCVVEHSPFAAHVAQRFQAEARTYPNAAQALVGIKRGECEAVVEDRALLETVAEQPEWRRYARLLPSMPELAVTFRVQAREAERQSALQPLVDRSVLTRDIQDNWINEVIFQAYVLADTLDCH